MSAGQFVEISEDMEGRVQTSKFLFAVLCLFFHECFIANLEMGEGGANV
jgi:hypothetical protein